MASVSSGIRRKVDDLGRVVIPAGIRRSLNIREGDAVEVSVDGERVVLSKPRDACVFCGREGDDLHRFRSRLVCRECVGTIGQVDDQLRAATPAPPDAPALAAPTTAPAPPAPAPAAPPTLAASPVPAASPAAPPAAASAPTPSEPAPPDVAPPAPAAAPATAPADDEPAWPAGPIDGDAFARDHAARTAARRRSSTADPAEVTAEPADPDDGPLAAPVEHADPDDTAAVAVHDDETDAEGRPPPYDPAATTAW